jgi:hypothetical protein
MGKEVQNLTTVSIEACAKRKKKGRMADGLLSSLGEKKGHLA